MTLYAHSPGRRLLQVTADVLFVCWVLMWAWMGMTVHDGTMALAAPGRQTDAAASALADRLRDAGGRIDDVPLVGEGAAVPFEEAASASDGIAAAGRASVEAVEDLALWLGLSIALIPILAVAAIHLPMRWRFIREATAGARFVSASEDLDLFALRALAHQPMHVLARVSDDPAGAWRRRDPDVVAELARLELRDVGLPAPRRTA